MKQIQQRRKKKYPIVTVMKVNMFQASASTLNSYYHILCLLISLSCLYEVPCFISGNPLWVFGNLTCQFCQVSGIMNVIQTFRSVNNPVVAVNWHHWRQLLLLDADVKYLDGREPRVE